MELTQPPRATRPAGQSGNRAIGQRVSVGSDFREMAIWQESQAFAEMAGRLVLGLRRDRAADPIGSQLIRAAGSVAANIAEGYGRFSQAAYRNHLSIARGSAFECESWLDLLMRLGYLSKEDCDDLMSKCVAVQKMLTVRMKSLHTARQTYARPTGGTS